MPDLGWDHLSPLPWVCFTAQLEQDGSEFLFPYGSPMMSVSCSALTAFAPDVPAALLRPDLIVTLVFLTFASLEHLYIIGTLHLATLNLQLFDHCFSIPSTAIMGAS